MSAPRSVLAGLIGAGIQASRTPALHEREGDAQGIRYCSAARNLARICAINDAP